MRSALLGFVAIMAAVAITSATYTASVSNCGTKDQLMQNFDISWAPEQFNPGDNITFHVSGNLVRGIKEAWVHFNGTYRGHHLYGDKFDLCKISEFCPAPAGPLNVTYTHAFPEIPGRGGDLDVRVNLRSHDQSEILCMDLQLHVQKPMQLQV